MASPTVEAIVPGTVSNIRHRLEGQPSSCKAHTSSHEISSKISNTGTHWTQQMSSSETDGPRSTRPDHSTSALGLCDNSQTGSLNHSNRYGNFNLSVQLSGSSRDSSHSGSQYVSVLSDGQSSLSTPTPRVATTPISLQMKEQESRYFFCVWNEHLDPFQSKDPTVSCHITTIQYMV